MSCIWSLLTVLMLGSPVREWVLQWAVIGPCLPHLFWALQSVSGFHVKLHLDLLTTLVLGFLGSKWLPWWTGFGPCLWCPSLLSREWVAAAMSCITLPDQPVFDLLQDVSAWCALLSVKSTDCINCSFSICFLLTLSFDCSDCMCSLDTDLCMHMTSWPDSKGYVTGHYSKCTVFVLQSFACMAHCISFFSALLLTSVVIIWPLVFPIIFVKAYLTFPKAVVLILKHATSLPYTLPGPALIQADLDHQKAGVDQRIRQYVATCQGHSAELDRAFIMAVWNWFVCSCVCSSSKHTKLYFQL